MSDPFIDQLMEHVKHTTNAAALRVGVMTLGALRTALGLLPPDTLVIVLGPVVRLEGDKAEVLAYASPSALTSYRGYYDRLAFTTAYAGHETTALDELPEPFSSEFLGDYQGGHEECTIAQPATAGGVVEALNLCDGATFEGYKGGQYLMDGSTFLHHADYGSTGTQIVGVELVDSVAVLLTAAEEF